MLEFLKALFNGLNALLTLGGSGALRKSAEHYRQAMGAYRGIYDQIRGKQAEIERHAMQIGVALTSAQRVLLTAERLLQQQQNCPESTWQRPAPQLFEDVHRFKSNFRQSLVGSRFLNAVGVSAGAATGGALSVGSWALVVSLGSASTGAAISGLSGVAASNAALAWFGGGALAAGGAGMAGGSLVLGAVALLPVVALSTWWTYRQARKFEEKALTLSAETQRCEGVLIAAEASRRAIDQKRYELVKACNAFQAKATELFAVIEPMGVFSRCKHGLLRWFGHRPLVSHQETALEQLASQVRVFLADLSAHKLN